MRQLHNSGLLASFKGDQAPLHGHNRDMPAGLAYGPSPTAALCASPQRALAHGPQWQQPPPGPLFCLCYSRAMARTFLYRCPNTGQTALGWSADEVTDDNGDGTYQSFARLACTRVHLVNLKTGKVAGLGGADDIVVSLPGSSVSWAPYIDGCFSLGSVHSIRILRVGVLAVTIDLHDIAGCASCGGPLGRAHQLKSATTEIRRS